MTNESSGPIETQVVEIKYPEIGVTYEIFDSTGQKWVSQAVAEHMLGIRWKQFDRYCDQMNPPVEKRRQKTIRYSYNFIKESDVYRIADQFQKIIRIPLKDIPTTDSNTKVFSKDDVKTMADKVVKEQASEFLKEHNERIKSLETVNANLSNEVVTLSKDKVQLVEEKYQILNEKRMWKTSTILTAAVLLIGGGVGGYFIFNLNSYNDQLISSSQTKSKIITDKDKEIYSLNDKLKNQEIEYLKNQISATSNTVK